ncbi:c-type cytochrome [Aestuariirhabdus sp. LZHN29]|uniref:c-type cytochrome n=1 Tax=Aestuariirhabdus sp. LZHN29 TaxID=3417462 RepID=UPI003CEFFFD5
MPILLRVVLFSLCLTLLFTGFANLLPQIEGEAEAPLAISTEDEPLRVAAGEQLFNGKGSCALCHNSMGRAPDLLAMDVVASASAQVSDPAYGGLATTAPAYLYESMVAPSVFVVPGYGIKGSAPPKSPMPDVSAAPISLTEQEMGAIIAYLQAKDGYRVTPWIVPEALKALRLGEMQE